MKLPRFVLLSLYIASVSVAVADGPADNQAATVRQVPPPGVMIDPADREALTANLNKLHGKLDGLRASQCPLARQDRSCGFLW